MQNGQTCLSQLGVMAKSYFNSGCNIKFIRSSFAAFECDLTSPSETYEMCDGLSYVGFGLGLRVNLQIHSYLPPCPSVQTPVNSYGEYGRIFDLTFSSLCSDL